MSTDSQLLLTAWHERRDFEARRRLIEAHLPLVRALASRFVRDGEQLEDLVQVGSVGLIKAVDRYDPRRGSSLSSARSGVTFATARNLSGCPARNVVSA